MNIFNYKNLFILNKDKSLSKNTPYKQINVEKNAYYCNFKDYDDIINNNKNNDIFNEMCVEYNNQECSGKCHHIETKNIKKKYKKKTINKKLRTMIWEKYNGTEFMKGLCACCQNAQINIMNFDCGHIVAESMGGETNLKNLAPICRSCNSSMGSRDMRDFMKELGTYHHLIFY